MYDPDDTTLRVPSKPRVATRSHLETEWPELYAFVQRKWEACHGDEWADEWDKANGEMQYKMDAHMASARRAEMRSRRRVE